LAVASASEPAYAKSLDTGKDFGERVFDDGDAEGDDFLEAVPFAAS
jgi:hypothetical protein